MASKELRPTALAAASRSHKTDGVSHYTRHRLVARVFAGASNAGSLGDTTP